MAEIDELIHEVELHDSSLSSLEIQGNGIVKLEIDIDDVWNQNLPKIPKGVIFHSVYEISSFKIDRLNIIGSIGVHSIETYNRDYVTHCKDLQGDAKIVDIEFVAGGNLRIICSGSAEFYY